MSQWEVPEVAKAIMLMEEPRKSWTSKWSTSRSLNSGSMADMFKKRPKSKMCPSFVRKISTTSGTKLKVVFCRKLIWKH